MNISQPPICDPRIMDLQQLCELIENYQRIIRFLNSEYDKILAQIEGSGTVFSYGTPLVGIAPSTPVPAGEWLIAAPTMAPDTAMLWFFPPPNPVPPAPLPGPAIGFWELGPGLYVSDGTRLIVALANVVLLPVKREQKPLPA
jgi:hypothetical protein